MAIRGSTSDKHPQPSTLEFNISKGIGGWPKTYLGQKFGPTLIRKALKSGLYVMAEISEAPVPVVVTDARWIPSVSGAIQIESIYGWRIPSKIYTVASLKGVKL